MCGIFGTTKNYSEQILSEKLGKMNHRGPDFSKYCEVKSGLVFGHNRLAIIDLDSRSNQPFFYENLAIVFNGEIYNYLELRKLLEENGYKFTTNSDTEVLCASYLMFGIDCVSHLNGMFAFVIYDTSNNKLFGARDRLGKKPFFYFLDNGIFEFASSLLALEIGNNFEILSESITKYLYWNYIPEPFTPYKNVYKLPSAHHFTYDLENHSFELRKYWDLPVKNNIIYSNYPVAINRLNSLIKEAVKLRMLSDVPLGVFLSGGIDSSLIAAVAQSQSLLPIKTFSIKFNEKEFDESFYAKEVAKLLKTEHREITCSLDDGINLIKNFSQYYDEPFADSSAIPTLLLSKYTSKEVTVALSGDGGDETFLGYNIYDTVKKRIKLFYFPKFFRLLLSKIITGIVDSNIRLSLIAKGLQLRDIKSFYISYFKGLNTNWITKDETEIQYLDYLMNKNKNLFECISDFDTKAYMNGDCITKVERASMAFSLEVRSPLMDYNIVEFSRQIPTDFKFSKGIKKRILKDLLYQYLPKDLFNRRKSGFSMPLGVWFRKELREYVIESFSKENLELVESVINVPEFLKIVDEHLQGKWDHTPKLWKVIVLINWLKQRNLKV